MITDNREDMDKILKNLTSLDDRLVKVGVFEGLQHKDVNREGKGKGKIIPMAMIAAVHEYGSEKREIPERSYMRSWAIEKKAIIDLTMQKLMFKVSAGEMTADQAMKRLVQFAKSGVRQQLLDLQVPVLKQRTIRRKGSSGLLRDSGQLLNSIQATEIKASEVIKEGSA